MNHFLQTHAERAGAPPPKVPTEVMNVLKFYHWPGNVRELQNALERACALCNDNTLRLKDLPERVLEGAVAAGAILNPDGTPAAEQETVETPADTTAKFVQPFRPIPLKDYLHQQEVLYIEQTVDHAGGNRAKAAELLGISAATLYRKLSGSTHDRDTRVN